MTTFNKISFLQIAGSTQLRQEVDALIASYAAGKVITTVVKTEAVGTEGDPGYTPAVFYTTDELLAKLKNDIEAITGNGSGTTLASLQEEIDNLQAKSIKDIVKVPVTITYTAGDPATYGVTLPNNIGELVPAMDTTTAIPVYNLDNTPILNASGDQLTISVTGVTNNGVTTYTGVVNGVPSTLDGTKKVETYVPVTTDISGKVFATGTFTLDTLPENYLLDNNELAAISYQQAINDIIVRLAGTDKAIDAIADKVGDQAVQDAIDAAVAALRQTVSENKAEAKQDDAAVIAALETELAADKAALTERVEVFTLTGIARRAFVLANIPNAAKIMVKINGFVYEETSGAFTVNRESKTVTWTATEANGGFNLTTGVANKVVIRYYTDDVSSSGGETTPGYRYGYRIKKSEENPAARVEYLFDAVGMEPAHMDFDTGVFDYGNWGDKWFVTENKPCMLKSDGTIDYYLDPNDYSKKEDGTPSDVANTNYDGNAMSLIPLVWVKRYEDDDYLYEIISDVQYDDDYKAYAHTRADGSIADWFAWSIYGGSGSESKIRSLSGQTLAQSLTTEQQISGSQVNGSGWYTHTWSQHELIRTLLILMGKSTDTQNVFGYGNGNTQIDGMLTTGTLNSMGQFYGYNSNNQQVKVFHIEKFWGDQWDRTAGVINNGGKIYVKMTPEGSGYRISDTIGYTNTGVTLEEENMGYISAATCSENGIIPTAVGDSETTFYCDYAAFRVSSLYYLLTGAQASTLSGAFAFNMYANPSFTSFGFGCGLSCEQPAVA